MAQVRRRLAAAAVLSIFAAMAQAADIALSEDGQGMGCQVRIDGALADGDADRLQELLAGLPMPDGTSPVGQRLCLNSSGGALIEAVRMADIVAQRFMGTAVPEGARCESACAVLFLSGRFAHPEADGSFVPDRVLHPRGALGFHAPALVSEDRAYSRDEVNRAYAAALGSMGEVMRVTSEIPESLFLTILNTPATDMSYVETVEQAARWQIEVAPVSLTAEDIESSLRFACLNADGGMMDTRASDSYLYGSANLPFTFGNLGADRAEVTSRGGFRAEDAANCELTLRADGDPLDRIGFLTMEGGGANEVTRREVYPYMFHDPRLPLSALPVARTAAETGEQIFFAAIQAAARAELSEVEIKSCWLISPEARIVNVNEYVNLRDGPGFEGTVLRKVPLGERVRVIATQDLRAPNGGDEARRCLRACNDLALDNSDADLRARVDRCIEGNVFWYEIRDGSGTAGYVSRKFLAD
ncbi:SH3 domain-containing protein [Mameliella alba]|nr:SH3 domain-containing protein [Mameliella alba]MBY6167783.1 SH3 domain-containing protein [Mameliella alba]MBY6172804.1 SH3 domain-containing protein [Mameliella alba]